MSGLEAGVSTGFAFLSDRIRAAVDALIAQGAEPGDPAAGFYISPEAADRFARTADPGDVDARLEEAARRLGLDALDAAVLGLCVAPELDANYGRVFAFLHDDVTRKLPSARVVALLLEGTGVEPGDVIASFGVDRPLRRLGCLELRDPDGLRPIADQPIRVAGELVSFLLGAPISEAPAGHRLRRVERSVAPLGRDEHVARIAEVLAQPSEMPVLLGGPDSPALLAYALDSDLLLVDARVAGDPSVQSRAALVCALEGRVAVFDRVEALDPPGRTAFAEALEGRPERSVVLAPTIEVAHGLVEVGAMTIEIPLPSLAERREAWAALAPGSDVDGVAAKFRLGITQVERAAEIARLEAGVKGLDLPGPAELDEGARRASSSRLGTLAARLDPSHTWQDLVLPERQLKLIRSVSAYLRQRDRVLGEWGYEQTVARMQGLKILFAGESGTGKTMAAQVLANDLGLQLFAVDLATIVSKYIGETEKNLERIFSAAEGSNAILFFDEADALFGKRSEVSDSHDRYANIEVAYLLQKMERYEGAVILATNFKQNLDDAFLRRLDFVIDFPFPEPEDRLRIWSLVIPDEAPRETDVDFDFLANRFKLSGGSIRNCSLAAAFEAADADRPIAMEHLVRAVAVEYAKQGRLTLESDFEHYHWLLADGERPAPKPTPQPPPAAPPVQRKVVRSRVEEL